MNRHTATDPLTGMVCTRNSKEHVYHFAVFVTYTQDASAHYRGKRECHGWSSTADLAAKSVASLTRPHRRFRGDRQLWPAVIEADTVRIVPATVVSTKPGAAGHARRRGGEAGAMRLRAGQTATIRDPLGYPQPVRVMSVGPGDQVSVKWSQAGRAHVAFLRQHEVAPLAGRARRRGLLREPVRRRRRAGQR